MCYTIEQKLEAAFKRAKYWNDDFNLERIKEKLEMFDPWYKASGFAHPKIIAYSNDQPHEPELFNWGLIPHWVKTEKDAKSLWNKTINARGESIFEKPSFRDAAINKRCLIPVGGFYEHHHFKGKKYPFYITRKDNEPLNLAGLWSEWINQETGEIIRTCSIVTTKANELMAKIHNNPKLAEPRMPVILNEQIADTWLKPIETEKDREELLNLLKPFSNNELKAHTVRKLSGKEAVGNVPEASEEYIYEEHEF